MTESDLANRTKLAAIAIVIKASHLTRSIINQVRETHDVSQAYEAEFAYEALVFLLHLADREAFDALGHEGRCAYMDRLVLETAQYATSDCSGATEDYIIQFQQVRGGYYKFRTLADTYDHIRILCDRRSKDFSTFSILGDGSLLPLFWEFGRHTLNILGHPGDPELCLYIHFTVAAIYIDLAKSLNLRLS